MVRRRMAPSFSVNAMRNQEHVIHQYVDLFVKLLGRLSEEKTSGINMSEVFAWLTFDIFCKSSQPSHTSMPLMIDLLIHI
jgi:hypothetical protein